MATFEVKRYSMINSWLKIGANGLMTDESVSLSVRKVQSLAEIIRNNVERVIIGKRDIIDLLIVALFSDGHVLIEDVPGIGKTMMAKSLARSLGATFQRIQGTPDLLPTDITGVSYFDQLRNEFVFRQGPLFTQILLVDEINRATPRTQSALLESMAERQVTVERTTMPLPKPFLVIATQNPIELEGTFPLPEAQLDRFLLRLQSGHPSAQLGVSPRGSLALYRASEAFAALQGRDYVQPDDVKHLAPSVLSHRLLTTSRSRMRGQQSVEIINTIVRNTPVPVENIAPSGSR